MQGRFIGAADAERDMRGELPRWTMYVQAMPERDAEKTPYNPFDLTKVWPRQDYPLNEVGVVELNRDAENYYAEMEQAAQAGCAVADGVAFRLFATPGA